MTHVEQVIPVYKGSEAEEGLCHWSELYFLLYLAYCDLYNLDPKKKNNPSTFGDSSFVAKEDLIKQSDWETDIRGINAGEKTNLVLMDGEPFVLVKKYEPKIGEIFLCRKLIYWEQPFDELRDMTNQYLEDGSNRAYYEMVLLLDRALQKNQLESYQNLFYLYLNKFFN